ncbi:MAG TPA: class I SAM-dependent methyltransferase [Baekduia sp.]|jgi:SAM-dependent methyltransferase|nr:class I SAM-dependent methyltransferase [Baekduia sp.]
MADQDEPRDRDATRLARASLAADDPTGWFERLYAAAQTGDAIVPWDRSGPNPLLQEWIEQRGLDGTGRRAVVVGAGPGHDAELLARVGFATVAFDISETAVRAARSRFPESRVDYVAADLLDPPAEWHEAFDLVVEVMTVQALPDPPRGAAIAQVSGFVAPGGTLLAVAAARADGAPAADGPPWPLTRREIQAFATGGLQPVTIEIARHAQSPVDWWRAELRRPG